MNIALNVVYTRQKVKKVLLNTGNLKAPGSDGLHVVFYKKKSGILLGKMPWMR